MDWEEQIGRSVINVMEEGVLALSADGVILYTNPQFPRMLEIEPDEVIGRQFEDFFIEEDRSICKKLIFQNKPVTNSTTLTLAGLKKRKKVQIIKLTPDGNSSGGIYLLVKEQANAGSDDQFRQISEKSGDVVWNLDLRTLKFSFISSSVYRLRGMTQDEVMAEPIEKSMTPESYQKIMGEVEGRLSAYRTGDKSVFLATTEIDHYHKNGSIVPAEMVTTLVEDDTGHVVELVGITRDISQRKRAQEELRRSEERFSKTFHSNPVGIVITEWASGKVIDLNNSYERISGFTRNELIGFTTLELGIFSSPVERTEIVRRLEESGVVNSHKMTLRTKSGNLRNIMAYLDMIELEGEKCILSFINDVTDWDLAEETLRFEKERFDKIAATVPGLIFSFHLYNNGSVSMPYASSAIEDLFGLQAEDVKKEGTILFSRINPEDTHRVNESIKQSAITMTPWKEWLRYQHPIKGEIWLEGHSMPMREPDGSVIWHGFVTDITERIREENALRESEERYRSIVENATIGIVVHVNNKVVYGNNTMMKMIGMKDPGLLFGNNVMDFVHPEDRPMIMNLIQQAYVRHSGNTMDGEPVVVEERLICLDGNIITVEASAIIINFYGSLGLLVMVNDITEKRRAKNELLQLNKDLEDRVRERTALLEMTNHELEAFSYSVSHDLRTPLRVMDNFSKILLEEYADSLDDAGRDYLNRISSASNRMQKLIEDLLKLAKITRGEIHKTQVNLSEKANKIIQSLREAYPSRVVEWSATPNVIVTGDSGLLEVALTNLLENSFKFTQEKTDACIEFGMIEKEGERIYFVRDNGVGFDMAYASKLYGAFQRFHSTNRFEGTGIGLAIVKRIINRHGGTIWAESAIDQGATFYFLLH